MACTRYKISISMIVTLLFLAFVAPIPAAKIIQEAKHVNQIKTEKFRLQKGCFAKEKSLEFNETKYRLLIKGIVFEKHGKNIAKYNTLITTESDDGVEIESTKNFTQEIPSEITLEKNGHACDKALALDDYGEFEYYWWYCAKMVSISGSTQQRIAYDHPDNYYYQYYHPQEWNLNWYREMQTDYAMIHLSQSEVANTILTADIGAVALVIADVAVTLYMLTITSMTLALWIVAGLMAFLAIYSVAFSLWANHVLQAEQGDGWAYTYWNGWYLQASYGGWKDYWIISW